MLQARLIILAAAMSIPAIHSLPAEARQASPTTHLEKPAEEPRAGPIDHARADPRDLLQRAMELNRAGQWTEAAKVAGGVLDQSGSSLDERCEAIFTMAYSRTRLGDTGRADGLLDRFRKECAGLARHSWVRGEVKKLEAELRSTGKRAPRNNPGTDGFWRSAEPSSLGLNADVVEEHERLCERTGADSCLVVYKGEIVSEWYSAGYSEPVSAMSSTKSVTSLLVGMLIADGKIQSLDDPVERYLPQWGEGMKKKVTLRHLLSHTAGLAKRDRDGVGYVADKNPFVIGLPLAWEPGSRFVYSNEGAQLLSPILDRAAGQPIQDYARRRLFEPLGMNSTRLHLDSKGHAWTYADMETTPRDFARIGVLMLDRGVWQGRRIVPEDWIARSTIPSQPFRSDCGLLWWLFEEPKGFAALGYLDTNLYVFPSLGLIVVRTQAKPSESGSPRYQPDCLSFFTRMVSASAQ